MVLWWFLLSITMLFGMMRQLEIELDNRAVEQPSLRVDYLKRIGKQIFECRPFNMRAKMAVLLGGKSGLRRARCQVTPGER